MLPMPSQLHTWRLVRTTRNHPKKSPYRPYAFLDFNVIKANQDARLSDSNDPWSPFRDNQSISIFTMFSWLKTNPTYPDRYRTAANASKRLGLSVPFCTPSPMSPITDDTKRQIASYFVNQVGFPEPGWQEKIVLQCLSAHFIALSALSKVCGSDVAFTIGWVSFDSGDEFFKFSRKDFKNWLRYGVPNFNKAPIHAWITLPNMEVIDFTFATSYFVVNDHPVTEPAFDIGFEEKMSGRHYHPIAVGNDLLQRLNLIQMALVHIPQRNK